MFRSMTCQQTPGSEALLASSAIDATDASDASGAGDASERPSPAIP
jgi:hypothetical protein